MSNIITDWPRISHDAIPLPFVGYYHQHYVAVYDPDRDRHVLVANGKLSGIKIAVEQLQRARELDLARH
jgi:hypothetical protein